jgi:general secretion pathway protein E
MGIGYLGRFAIMELLVMTDTIRRLILKHGDASAIHEVAVGEGMQPMYEDGLYKAVDGQTTLEEIMRVTQES